MTRKHTKPGIFERFDSENRIFERVRSRGRIFFEPITNRQKRYEENLEAWMNKGLTNGKKRHKVYNDE